MQNKCIIPRGTYLKYKIARVIPRDDLAVVFKIYLKYKINRSLPRDALTIIVLKLYLKYEKKRDILFKLYLRYRINRSCLYLSCISNTK